MSIASLSRRRTLKSFIAVFTAAAGFASSSCASPRLPTEGYPLRLSAAGYEVQVLVDGAPVPTYDRAGETYVLGQLGARYTLRIVNHTGRRIEAVTSIDGRDAIDGKSADVRAKRGYLVQAWGSVDIDGWRLSRAEVAAFRFSSVADSYAARTGTAREVGVIGVAVFPERFVPPRPVYVPRSDQQPRRFERYDDMGDLGAVPPNPSGSYAAPKASRSQAPIADAAPAPAPASAATAASESSPRSPAPPQVSPRTRSKASAAREAESSALPEGGAFSGAEPARRRRPGLGTEFGEAVTSPVREVSFARANPTHPVVVLGARYNDREGLLALGIDVDGWCSSDDDLSLRQTATPFPGGDRRYAAPPAGWRQGCCVRY